MITYPCYDFNANLLKLIVNFVVKRNLRSKIICFTDCVHYRDVTLIVIMMQIEILWPTFWKRNV